MELIDWLQHWDEMRFYYRSGLSWLVLLPVYLGGLLLLGLLAWLVGKVTKRIWVVLVVVVVLLPVLAIAPWWEELGIAYNFGQLCKKDAGIFVYKTVEVDGFYDATRPTHAGTPTAQAIEALDKGGYRFYEFVLRNRKGGPDQVVHIEKKNGVWTPTVLDQPTARYHFQMDAGVKVARGVRSQTSTVIDTESRSEIARYTRYNRAAPWFFVGLDRPRFACDGPDGGPNTKHSFLLYREVLKPVNGASSKDRT